MIKELIEALTIFSKYLDDTTPPTHCEHDVLTVCVEYSKVTETDRERLEKLGFHENTELGLWSSFRFGSA